jgi:ubiquinone/menaquinone biosynthesis C-methylase UbiE
MFRDLSVGGGTGAVALRAQKKAGAFERVRLAQRAIKI